MKFIEFAHPEGGRLIVHVDHITSCASIVPGEGDVKTRLGLDLDERQNDIVIFGEEAEQVWQTLQRLKRRELNQDLDPKKPDPCHNDPLSEQWIDLRLIAGMRVVLGTSALARRSHGTDDERSAGTCRSTSRSLSIRCTVC